MLTVEPAFIQWCIGTATMILFVEKVLAALVHWRALFVREQKDAMHRLEMPVELIGQCLDVLIERLHGDERPKGHR
jgi:hypothetical protein